MDQCIDRCKSLTGTLSTLKKLAGVQEARTRTLFDESSLQRSYRATDTRDPIQIHKSLLREVESLSPVDHTKRITVINQWEPRWAMQRYRNIKYETAKFEKVNTTDNEMSPCHHVNMSKCGNVKYA